MIINRDPLKITDTACGKNVLDVHANHDDLALTIGINHRSVSTRISMGVQMGLDDLTALIDELTRLRAELSSERARLIAKGS